MTEPSADAPLATQLSSLMQLESCEDWLQACDLIHDNMPESITTFDALDEMLDLDAYDCAVNDMFYELEETRARIW